jgi:hypothetical protein
VGKEIRTFQVEELRVVSNEGEAPVIEGYAAVFGVLSEDLGGFREMIEPGAFKRTLEEGADVLALWDHESPYVLGRRSNDTLLLKEDEKGLRVRILPPDTQWARDALVSIRRGDVKQMSFGFRTVRDEWHQDDAGAVSRTLLDVDLFEVSPVAFPAYRDTVVEARARFEQFKAGGQAAPEGEARTPRVRLALARLRMALDSIIYKEA